MTRPLLALLSVYASSVPLPRITGRSSTARQHDRSALCHGCCSTLSDGLPTPASVPPAPDMGVPRLSVYHPDASRPAARASGYDDVGGKQRQEILTSRLLFRVSEAKSLVPENRLECVADVPTVAEGAIGEGEPRSE